MNSWAKKYKQSLTSISSPILLSQMTKRVRIQDLMLYAKNKGVKVADLTEDEKKIFIKQ